jgi:hypothetical protein
VGTKEHHAYVNGDFQRRMLEEELRLRREVAFISTIVALQRPVFTTWGERLPLSSPT